MNESSAAKIQFAFYVFYAVRIANLTAATDDKSLSIRDDLHFLSPCLTKLVYLERRKKLANLKVSASVEHLLDRPICKVVYSVL